MTHTIGGQTKTGPFTVLKVDGDQTHLRWPVYSDKIKVVVKFNSDGTISHGNGEGMWVGPYKPRESD